MGTTKNIEDNLSSLDRLIGKENVDEVKKEIGKLIINRIADDIRSFDCYLFYPENYQEDIDEAFESIHKKIVKMYKDAALESAQEAVNRFRDISSAVITETPGLQLRSCHKCEYCEFNKCNFYNDYYWKAHDKLCAEEGFINYKEK